MEAIIINLERRKDRKSEMKAEMKNTRLDYSFFSAIDGNNLVDFKKDWLWENANIKACAMSHKYIAENSLLNPLVLEDDVILTDKFDAKLNCFLNTVPSNWDCLYLGFTPISWCSKYENKGCYYVLKEKCMGAWAYMIRGDAKTEFVHLLDTMPADNALASLQSKYNFYSSAPFLAKVRECYSDTSMSVSKWEAIDEMF